MYDFGWCLVILGHTMNLLGSVFREIVEMQEQASKAWSNYISILYKKERNRSLVKYDRSIANTQIKRNQYAHKNPIYNRRLQTKRVMTHNKK